MYVYVPSVQIGGWFINHHHNYTHGGGIGANEENHVRENIGGFYSRHVFFTFFWYTIASTKCKFGNYM